MKRSRVDPGENGRREIVVRRWVSGPMSRVARQERTLRQHHAVRTGAPHQRMEPLGRHPARIRRGEADPGPELGPALHGERRHGRGEALGNTVLHEPERSTETTIETFAQDRITEDIRRNFVLSNRGLRSKVPMVEAKSVENQDSGEVSLLREDVPMREPERPDPEAGSDIGHVSVILTVAGEKSGEMAAASGNHAVEDEEAHRRAFTREPMELWVDEAESRLEPFSSALFEGRVVVLDDRARDELEPPPRRRFLMESANFRTPVAVRQTEDEPP